ncbi:hypothetical protein ACHWQZ_G006003 [Mnemiopsis leidyi]
MDDDTRDLIAAVGRGKLTDPLKYEDWIDDKTQILKECDPHLDLMLFPDDDIEVTTYTKEFRTGGDMVPIQAMEYNEENPHVQDSVKMTIQDWNVVNRRYEKGSSTATLSDDKSRNSVEHKYEVDLAKSTVLSTEEKEAIQKNENNRSSFASLSEDTFDMSEGDSMILGYLKDYTLPKIKYTDTSNKNCRAKNRPPALFSLYPNPQSYHLDERIESRKRPPVPPAHCKPYRIMITFTKLEMTPAIEPFYASMSLYDAKLKKKVSETFYFDLNSNEMLKKANHRLDFDKETRGSSAIFSITEPTSDMFVVVRLDKTLQKDELSDSFEAYTKDTDNQRIASKNASIAEDFCSRLGNHRMPYLWVGFNLERALQGSDGMFLNPDARNGDHSLKERDLNNSGGSWKSESDNYDSASLNSLPFSARFPSMDKKYGRMGSMSAHSSAERIDSSEIKTNLTNFPLKKGLIPRMFKQEVEHLNDDDICKYLFEINNKKNSTLKRLKIVPIHMELEIQPAPQVDQAVLTPALRQVLPYSENKQASESERWNYPVREVEEFPGREVYIPYHDYKNFLYIYPLSLNFNNRTGSCRNIKLKVQVLEAEGKNGILECIYGRSSSRKMISEISTVVQYHNKNPYFYEEVKIELPPYLTKKHHLLFKFYHIVCQNPKPTDKQKTDKEQLIGVTWLPLRMRPGEDNTIMKDDVLALALGEHRLPVCTDLNEAYSCISPKQVKLPSLQWIDDYKDLFHFRISAVSSIHLQDERLNEFTLCYYKYNAKLQAQDDAIKVENYLKKSIDGLQNAQDVPLVRHLYLVLDRLFALLVKPTLSPKGGTLSAIAFKAISDIVRKVHELHRKKEKPHGRNSILASYVAYIFSTPHDEVNRGNSRAASLSRFNNHSSESEPSSEDLETPRNSPTKHSPIGQRCKSFSAAHSEDLEVKKSPSRGRSGSIVKKVSKRLHEQVVSQWIICDSRDQSFEHSWFFFEIIIKSMAQHLSKLPSKGKSRMSWFPKDFKDDLNRLLKLVSGKILGTVATNPPYAQFVNKSLAYFLQDLFSLMDRGFVFELVKMYWICMEDETPNIPTEESIAELKLNLLQVLCLHEHFVQLNLPYPHSLFNEKNSIKPHQFKAKLKSTKTAQSLTSLNKTYCERHYLVGLLLSMEAHILNFSTNPTLQRAVILLTRDILYRHDNEPSLQDPARRSRVASLYLPFVTIVMDVYDKLWKDFNKSGSRSASVTDRIYDDDGIAQSPMNTLRGSKKQGQIPPRSTRTLLLCVLSVLKNCDDELLKKWLISLKPNRINTLISIIKLCVSCFEYHPVTEKNKVTNRTAEKAEEAKLKLEAMFNDKGMRGRHLKQSSTDQISGSRGFTRNLHTSKSKPTETDGIDDPSNEEEASESLVCAETSIVTLDTIELLVESGSVSEGGHVNLSSPLVSKILDVILLMMSSNQSIYVMRLVFATQRSVITKFPHIIFEEETDQCSSLCYHLLRHCASSVKEVREESIASIYLLMRQNYESVGSFSRVKIQLTIALSRLRSDSSDTRKCNDAYLKRSLITLQNYAENDKELASTRFPEQVKEVSKNLFMIMRDTVRMNEVKQDKDSAMRIDLMYRIAKGYQNSPALRITWLKSMAKEHGENDQKCEAAMCYVHAAALISEYMYMVEHQPALPQGCIAFKQISPNVLQECAVMDDVLKPDEDGMCTGGEFSEKGITSLLRQSADLLMESNMYESVDKVYNLLSKIYLSRRHNYYLGGLHRNLHTAYEKMHQMGKKRQMGCYFRVAFYGEKFNELNGVTMIYKEKPFTKLPEIAHRLQNMYYEQFGDDFEFISDSKRIDPESIDPYRAYVQVTYVEPYFEQYEKKYRKDDFEYSYNVDRFYYSTPFTHSGSAHGAVGEQFKRVTVLTTEFSFPYVKNRLQVVDIKERVMTPIEVATEDMTRKNEEFDEVLRTNRDGKVDVKMLQMLIQGAIGTTVNQGPLEIIETFLGENSRKPEVQDDKYIKYRNRLKYQCKTFLNNIKAALNENRNIIGTFQEDYQREMEENLKRFKLAVSPFIFNPQTHAEVKHNLNRSYDPENSLSRTMSYDYGGQS